ncbi:E3 ubiquitin-protein ligase PUB23-like [Humulus lupulus]|uniref:E3 ubiquitin-protein ligase PUB23-like n=1 Tax=Humulus lupulus TaxID=3486 RepID=UPI002B4070D6|nr:E3 ubiquitin-protein ligase PUB23-like [Humulus lupulus]
MEEFPPHHFLCPISREVMKEPVTIFSGVTYDRTSIEKWFFTYKKKTCPATMQKASDFTLTPNHTLNRLILSWESPKNNTTSSPSSSSSSSSNGKQEHMVELLSAIDSSPFKVRSLKELSSLLQINGDDAAKSDLIRSNGVQILCRILTQILLSDASDFVTFRACEEAIAVLYQLVTVVVIVSEKEEEKLVFDLLSQPDSMRSMAIMLQRASAETRLHTLSILRNIAKKTDYDWNSDAAVIIHQGTDFFKSLLELVSDQISTKASSAALEVLIEILSKSKKSRLRAIEAGAVCVLVELLPESNRSRCEKMLYLTKLVCECAEGRTALVEHGMGIAAVSKKMLEVSRTATKVAVKVLNLVSCFHGNEKVLEEMVMCGAVKKLVALLHMDGRSSTKEKVVKMFKLHANSWKRYPCFAIHFNEYLGLIVNSNNNTYNSISI